jgi:predicted ATPase
MLTRIYIDNYLSFVNFEFRFGAKQLLLGANGSGKSSLLTAVRDLKKFIRGEANPFVPSTRTRWQSRPTQVIEIEADLSGTTYKYRMELVGPLVGVERLAVSGVTVFEVAGGVVRFFANGAKQAIEIPLETNKSALRLSQLSNSHVRQFVDWVESINCFRIDQYPDAMDESSDKEDPDPDDEFQNLAGWYRHLVLADPAGNVKFLSSMREALDSFETLRFAAEESGVKRLRADFSGPANQRLTYSISELSEGQRSLIALYMILHFLLVKGRTVFIDEPDNFIALREIQPWLLAAEEAVDDHKAQLTLISHHPEVLNQWATAYGVHFFREGNGHVRAEKFKADPNGDLLPSELIARGWEDE